MPEPNYLTHPELFPGAKSFSPPGKMPDEARRAAQSWLDRHEEGTLGYLGYVWGWAAALAFIPKDECLAVWVPKRRALEEAISARQAHRARAMGLLRQRWPERCRVLPQSP